MNVIVTKNRSDKMWNADSLRSKLIILCCLSLRSSHLSDSWPPRSRRGRSSGICRVPCCCRFLRSHTAAASHTCSDLHVCDPPKQNVVFHPLIFTSNRHRNCVENAASPKTSVLLCVHVCARAYLCRTAVLRSWCRRDTATAQHSCRARSRGEGCTDRSTRPSSRTDTCQITIRFSMCDFKHTNETIVSFTF